MCICVLWVLYLLYMCKLSCFNNLFAQDVLNDIKGAQDVGMRGILVKTGQSLAEYIVMNCTCDCVYSSLSAAGKYRYGDENTIHPPPALVCDNFASAVECILNNQSV